MQRAATASESRRRRISSLAAPVVACALGVSLVLTPIAFAQEATPAGTPDASPVAETSAATVSEIYQVDVDEFPAVPVSVRLLRMTLAPGASSPMHTHPGHEIDLVESGTLTVNSGGDAVVIRDGEATTATLVEEPIGAGELVHFPPDVGMNLVNASDEDVVLLSAVFHPVNEDLTSTVYTDGTPEANAFDGVSYVVLGDGIIQDFAEGPATIHLESIEAESGASLPGDSGAALYSLVEGDFAFAVSDGDVQVSRTASPSLRPNAAVGQEFTLDPGDAAFFPSGVVDNDRANQGGSVSILRLSAESAAGAAGDPAAITMLESAVEEPVAAGEFAIDAIATVNTDSVNMRAEPTTSAEVVDQLSVDTEVRIIGGPEDADDFTWWQVALVDDETVVGWIAQDFLSLPGAPEPTEEPEATEEPEEEEAGSTPQPATDAQFQVGDIVQTTEDNIRIRDEPSTEGEPITTFLAGTQFEVTGDPVEADDYVWYPVTLVEGSESGWIAEDFLEPVEDDEE